MNLLPKAYGGRPRLACELTPDGVVAARSPQAGAPLAAVARAALREGAVIPSLKPGNVVDRVAAVAAIRRTLESNGCRPNARGADLTLVIPDAAVRVLLVDFDGLPIKLSEALPLVRFRLKKLVPFDVDDAMVSFQILSTSRSGARVLAVAIPRDVLREYESAAREAGFEPGAVLPSTLASLAALPEGESAALVVNAHPQGVTTAIVRAGVPLLHLTVDLTEHTLPTPANLPPALFEGTGPDHGVEPLLPLVDHVATAEEWAAQEPLPEYGRNPYADRLSADAAVEGEDGITGMPVPRVSTHAGVSGNGQGSAMGEPAPPSRSPYLDPALTAELDAELHQVLLEVPLAAGVHASATPTQGQNGHLPQVIASESEEREPRVHLLAPELQAEEIARAVSVAVAYFEDSLGAPPEVVLSAGALGAEALERTLREQGLAQEDGLRVRELVDPAVLATAAISATVPRSALAGVVGALNS